MNDQRLNELHLDIAEEEGAAARHERGQKNKKRKRKRSNMTKSFKTAFSSHPPLECTLSLHAPQNKLLVRINLGSACLILTSTSARQTFTGNSGIRDE
jgi:hypothetical protein